MTKEDEARLAEIRANHWHLDGECNPKCYLGIALRLLVEQAARVAELVRTADDLCSVLLTEDLSDYVMEVVSDVETAIRQLVPVAPGESKP